MASSLLDLLPAQKKVHGIPVVGVRVEQFGEIVGRFPELVGMFGSGANVGNIVKHASKAIGPIIAAGIGRPDEEETAARLPVGVQLAFLTAIMEATFPDGVGPFMEELTKLMAGPAIVAQRPTTPTAPNKKASSQPLPPDVLRRAKRGTPRSL